MNIPRGERYELCRSVHAEANAIIAAARPDMLGSTLYLVGVEADGSYTKDARPCSMCARMIINAGIETVVVRNTADSYTVLRVSDFVEQDDSLNGTFGY